MKSEAREFNFNFMKNRTDAPTQVALGLNDQGVVDTPGRYFGIPSWGLIYICIAYQRLHNQKKDWKPDELVLIDVEDFERKEYGIHPSVKSIAVGRRGDGSYMVEEVT